MKSKGAFCGLLVLLLSSALMAQQVSVNHDHNANFAQYHTYAWGSKDTNRIQYFRP